MKRLIPIFSIVLAVIICAPGYASSDESWAPTPPPSSDPSWGILAQGVSQTYTLFATPSLMSFKSDTYVFGVSKVLSVRKCAAFGSFDCPSAEFQKYHSPLSYCSNTATSDCVLEVSATKSDGTPLLVNYVGSYGGSPAWAFTGDKSINLPSSGRSFLVDIPGAPHAGGSKYLVSAVLDGFRYPGDSQFSTNGLQATIWPVSLETGNFQPYSEALDPNSYSALGINAGVGSGCVGVQSDVGSCAVQESLPLDVSFGLKLKLATKVRGWLHGRISHVSSSVGIANDGDQLVSISGNPVKVPTIFGWVSKSAAPKSLTDFYNTMDPFELNMGSGYGKCLDPSGSNEGCNPKYWESVLRNPGTSKTGMEELSMWLPIVNDKAVASPTAWTVRTLNGNINNCGTDRNRLIGFVNTNATLYEPQPPLLNPNDGTLDYQVLAPHFLQDGSVFEGTYDLLIDSSVARCIYQFTSAPIKATVSVVSSNGAIQTVTTALSESNGFIHLSANGFTFSNPTIKVKLTQDAPTPAPTPSASPTPTVEATPAPSASPVVAVPTPKPSMVTPKKSTITCVKGKSTKSVTAVKPTCPTGYKKK